MELTFFNNGVSYDFNTSEPIDISLPVTKNGKGANCFYTDRPVFKPYRAGNFVGSVAEGGACNVEVINFTPHGNGTHTECIGHINALGLTIIEALKESWLPAALVTVKPGEVNGDLVITRAHFENAAISENIEALIVRTLPNEDSKLSRDYSGTNPSYFSPESLQFLNRRGIKHLLCDVPSVDREDDGGKLLAHKAFFGVPELPLQDATITELVYIPSGIRDGLYMLNLQIAPFQSDASPSRPLIFELRIRS